MKYAAITERLAGLGGAKWEVHARAKAMQAAGESVIQLTIGEPDVATPASLLTEAKRSIDAGRLGYSNGRGEAELLAALAKRYSARSGRTISPQQITAFPGTQTSLYAVLMALTEAGDEVIIGDPMYATYEGLIAASGAVAVPVTLRAEHGFRMQAEDVAALVTPRTRVIFLNTPHNPTGAVLRGFGGSGGGCGLDLEIACGAGLPVGLVRRATRVRGSAAACGRDHAFWQPTVYRGYDAAGRQRPFRSSPRHGRALCPPRRSDRGAVGRRQRLAGAAPRGRHVHRR